MSRLAVAAVVLAVSLFAQRFSAQELSVPNRPDSVKFAAIGDTGTGEQPEYDVANQMDLWRRRFPFDTVIMLGDNIYGSQRAADFTRKFEHPFKPLLDAGVKFYATLGNHDRITSDAYAPFNMGGERYYTYAKGNVRFFVLDSNALDAAQLAWTERALSDAHEAWKIAYFHHPIYSGGGRHPPAMRLEPMFVKYGVSVVYSGHVHIYERVKPQQGIYYFVSGAAGQLQQGGLKRSGITEAGFDRDRSFMLNEVAGDDLYFQVISRTGQTVDRGAIHRPGTP